MVGTLSIELGENQCDDCDTLWHLEDLKKNGEWLTWNTVPCVVEILSDLKDI